MTLGVHAGIRVLIARTDGDRALILAHGVEPRWVPVSEVNALPSLTRNEILAEIGEVMKLEHARTCICCLEDHGCECTGEICCDCAGCEVCCECRSAA